jgi:hypothetical protein
MAAKPYRKTVRDPKTGTTLTVGNAGDYAQLTQGQGWVDVSDEKPAEGAKSDSEPAPTVTATQTAKTTGK